jgi:hypothetical protein
VQFGHLALLFARVYMAAEALGAGHGCILQMSRSLVTACYSDRVDGSRGRMMKATSRAG